MMMMDDDDDEDEDEDNDDEDEDEDDDDRMCQNHLNTSCKNFVCELGDARYYMQVMILKQFDL